MKTSTIIWICVGIVVVLFFGFLTVRYFLSKDRYKSFILPRLKLSLIEIKELSRQKIETLVTLKIHNPLPFGFGIKKIDYQLRIDGMEIMSIHDPDGLQVKRAANCKISVPITFLPENMRTVIRKAKESLPVNKIPGGHKINNVPYEFHVDIHMKILFFKKRWKTVIRKELPLFQVPQMRYEGISMHSLKWKGADLCLNLKLFNKNKFAITAQDIAYRFVINEKNWITGTIPGHVRIPSREQTMFSFPLQILFKNMSLWNTLKKRGNLHYDLILTLRLDSNNIVFNNSRIIVENSGRLGNLIQFIRHKQD